MARRGLTALAAVALLALAACSAGVAPPSTATGSGTATASGTPNPAPGMVMTLRVGDEEYRVLLTDPVEIATAQELAAGTHAPLIPVGTVVRTDDGGVNSGYSWHIDPASFEWAELTMEVCDGRPSYVENGTLSGDTFCPWSAEVVSVEPGR